jgi:hypothetical protein
MSNLSEAVNELRLQVKLADMFLDTSYCMDLLIGVQARSFGMPLLAGCDNHFRKIQGLIVEDY